MANEPESQPFARDLGYLDKFFVNLTAHAGTLPEAQGQRLQALVEEEVARWSEIRQLLTPAAAPAEQPTGAPAEEVAAAKPEAKPAAVRPPAAPPAPRPAAAPQPPLKPQPGFTVGSLYGQPKK